MERKKVSSQLRIGKVGLLLVVTGTKTPSTTCSFQWNQLRTSKLHFFDYQHDSITCDVKKIEREQTGGNEKPTDGDGSATIFHLDCCRNYSAPVTVGPIVCMHASHDAANRPAQCNAF
jgi:hypothetical protein